MTATTIAVLAPEAVPSKYAATTTSACPVSAAQPANTKTAPHRIGVTSTARVTVIRGRRASAPKNAALSNPAIPNTTISARKGNVWAAPGATDGVGAPGSVTIRTQMRTREHSSTTRIARVARRTPRTAMSATTLATSVTSTSSGRVPGTEMSRAVAIPSKLTAELARTDTAMPR